MRNRFIKKVCCLFLIIISLFLCACQKIDKTIVKYYLIYQINDVSKKNKSFKIDFFTTLDVTKISIHKNKYINNYISKSEEVTIINNEQQIKGYHHELVVYPVNDICEFNKINVLINKKTYELSFGLYANKKIPINNDLDIQIIINESLKIMINNKTSNIVFLNNINLVYDEIGSNIEIEEISKSNRIIYPYTMLLIDNIKINLKNDYSFVSSYFLLKYQTSLDYGDKYFNYQIESKNLINLYTNKVIDITKLKSINIT